MYVCVNAKVLVNLAVNVAQFTRTHSVLDATHFQKLSSWKTFVFG